MRRQSTFSGEIQRNRLSSWRRRSFHIKRIQVSKWVDPKGNWLYCREETNRRESKNREWNDLNVLFWSMSLWLNIINRMSLWFNWTVCVEIGGDRVLVGLWCTVHILAQYPWDPLVIKSRHWKRSRRLEIVGWRYRWGGFGRVGGIGRQLDGDMDGPWQESKKRNLKILNSKNSKKI